VEVYCLSKSEHLKINIILMFFLEYGIVYLIKRRLHFIYVAAPKVLSIFQRDIKFAKIVVLKINLFERFATIFKILAEIVILKLLQN